MAFSNFKSTNLGKGSNRGATKREQNNLPRKSALVLLLALLIIASLCALTACDPAIKEGTVIEVYYGILAKDLGGGVSIDFGNRENMYIKVSDGRSEQWFKVNDPSKTPVSVGDSFKYNRAEFTPVPASL